MNDQSGVAAGNVAWPADQRLIAVQKTSGLEFVHAANTIWRARDILQIGACPGAGIVPDEQREVKRGGGWIESEFAADPSDILAQISSTSGTTGPPKAIAISRRAISDTVARLVTAMELDSSIREYIAVPVTFSFGLGRARAVAAVGGASFLPDSDFRPDEIASMLRTGKINALSAVPTMLRTLVANPELVGSAGRRLRWLEIGSQYMSADEKIAIRKLFPEAIILQHYGLTEASRSTFLRIDRANGEALESVGQPFCGGAARIGENGCIEVSGPHLASGVIVDGAMTPLARDGWLRTADLGEIRDGHLHYLGRADDVANIGGIKVSAEHFERELAALTNAGGAIATCVVDDALRGHRLAVANCGIDPDILREAATQVGARYGLRLADLLIAPVADIPRTATGKVRRTALAELVKKASPAAPAPQSESGGLSAREAEIASIWQEVLGVDHVGPDHSFYDLGGDSLSAISVMLKSEHAGLAPDAMQRMFGGETVAQIARAMDGSTRGTSARNVRSVRADALNAVRGLFALLIVVSHWAPYFIERMGTAGAAIWQVLAPLLRIGTPGFAMVYGMGLGLFFFNHLDGGGATRRRIRNNTALLVAGVLLIAAPQAWRLVIAGEDLGPNWPELLFYEVLLFYALMVPTSLFWLRLVARARDPIFASLLLAAGAYGFYGACVALWPINTFTGWGSLGWHMLVAPYAYPRLLGATALGLAAALWLTGVDDLGRLRMLAAKWGTGLASLGFLLVSFIPGGWGANAGSVVAVMAFAGLALLLYAAAISRMGTAAPGVLLRMLIICGLIAFPIFIGHGLVAPLKLLLEQHGFAGLSARLLPATAFVISMFWLGRRLYILRFGREPR